MIISRRDNRRGFTLIEMVVVLAILALLTLVALRATSGIVDQARYEANRKLLNDIAEAIVGKQGAGAIDSVPYCFVADMGAIPTQHHDNLALMDLWQMPQGAKANQLKSDAIDPEIKLSVGWRGPYIQLASGVDSLLDVYGNPLKVIFPSTQIPANPKFSITSLGSDGALDDPLHPPKDYEADQTIIIIPDPQNTNPSDVIDKTTTTVAGSVTIVPEPQISNWKVVVFVYQPDPMGVLAPIQQNEDPQELPVITSQTSLPPIVYTFDDPSHKLTPGIRAFRAYLFDPTQVHLHNNDIRTTALDKNSGKVSAISYRFLRAPSNPPAPQDLVIP
ncbi:MAG: type II secretion system protein [Planctomycetes bacterium]|nr:type II secretion system protein [Planctomycetota bacterium]